MGLRMMLRMYQVKRISRSEYVPIRKLQYHVQVWGEPEAMKRLHKELQPEKTFYQVTANSQSEAEELLEWFVKNT